MAQLAVPMLANVADPMANTCINLISPPNPLQIAAGAPQAPIADVTASHLRVHAMTKAKRDGLAVTDAELGNALIINHERQHQQLAAQVDADAPPAWAQDLLAQGAALIVQVTNLTNQVNINAAISFNSASSYDESILRPVPTAAGAAVPNFPATRGDLYSLDDRAQVQPLLTAYNIAAAVGDPEESLLYRDIRAVAAHIGLR